MSGSSAAALDLVYDSISPDLDVESLDGSKVNLVVRPGGPRSAAQLASLLVFEGLISAEATSESRIVARFTDEVTAMSAAHTELMGLDVGPFEVESNDTDLVRLRRRSPGAIQVIELHLVPPGDEWRMLLGRQLDVIPSASSLFRDEFEGLGSIRVVDVPSMTDTALWFNTRDPALSRPVRQRIAAMIDRTALARLACGREDCALAAPQFSDEAPPAALPERLSLLVVEDNSSLVQAAKVLHQQLGEAGIVVDVQPIPIATLVQRTGGNDFQVAVVTFPRGEHRFMHFVTNQTSVTGFSDPVYDEAYRRGDLAAAQEILDVEIPVTPLVEFRTFAAIDARFCGDVTPTVQSWRWIAELVPCDGDGR